LASRTPKAGRLYWEFVLDVHQQLGALSHQVIAPAHEISRRTHRPPVDVGLRHHPAAQQRRDLVRVDPIVLRLTAVNSLHVQRVPQHEHNPLALAQVRQPIPGEHALDRHGQILAVRRNQLEERFRTRRDVLRHQHRALGVEKAHVHRAGVKVDAAIVAMLPGIESHRGLLSKSVRVSEHVIGW
jgi:hypothetical protein